MPVIYQVPVIIWPRRRRVRINNHFPYRLLRADRTDGISGTVTAYSESVCLPPFPDTLLRIENDEFVSEYVHGGLRNIASCELPWISYRVSAKKKEFEFSICEDLSY
jgi:hypothetical protein